MPEGQIEGACQKPSSWPDWKERIVPLMNGISSEEQTDGKCLLSLVGGGVSIRETKDQKIDTPVP